MKPVNPLLPLALVVGLLGCASAGPPRFWRDSNGRIVVTGPMLGPAENLETLGSQLCEKVHEMPGATAGHTRGGQEYCGAIYQRADDTGYFASYPSTFSPPLDLPGGRKGCFPPSAVSDAGTRETTIHADYHSHPAISKFSPEDLQLRRQRFYFRLMFNTICEVYLYDFQARTVLQLQSGKFIPVKHVTDDLRGE